MVTVVVHGGPVTTAGFKDGDAQPGTAEALKETGLLKPFCGVTATVYDRFEKTPSGTYAVS
jgi:hypothetical protein